MLNVDAKRSGENNQDELSDEDNIGKSLSNLVERKLILPNLNQKPNISQINSMNMSIDEQIKFEEEMNINSNGIRESYRFDDINGKQNPYKPKMYLNIIIFLIL